MIRGGCLCGGVRFQVRKAHGPFELCHCSRCRKATGSAFAAGLCVQREDFTLLQGDELIQIYEAPIRESPPAFRRYFCRHCGSSVPDALSDTASLEVPAGTLDDDPDVRPERHIYVESKAPWYAIADSLPQLDRAALAKHRAVRPGKPGPGRYE